MFGDDDVSVPAAALDVSFVVVVVTASSFHKTIKYTNTDIAIKMYTTVILNIMMQNETRPDGRCEGKLINQQDA
jgi:hypothetical protein